MVALGTWGLAHRDGGRRLRSRAELLRDGCADAGEGSSALARPAIPDVRGQRRMQHLDRLHAEGLDAVEDPLA